MCSDSNRIQVWDSVTLPSGATVLIIFVVFTDAAGKIRRACHSMGVTLKREGLARLKHHIAILAAGQSCWTSWIAASATQARRSPAWLPSRCRPIYLFHLPCQRCGRQLSSCLATIPQFSFCFVCRVANSECNCTVYFFFLPVNISIFGCFERQHGLPLASLGVQNVSNRSMFLVCMNLDRLDLKTHLLLVQDVRANSTIARVSESRIEATSADSLKGSGCIKDSQRSSRRQV